VKSLERRIPKISDDDEKERIRQSLLELRNLVDTLLEELWQSATDTVSVALVNLLFFNMPSLTVVSIVLSFAFLCILSLP